MKEIKIMTYNVCWEAIEAKKGNIDMTKCKVKNKNKCLSNITKIINNRLEEDYDFICLQEINSTQWTNISDNMMIDDYNTIKKEVGPAGIITLYNNKYNLVKKYSGNLTDNHIDERPYMILVFNENIILISLHLSHIQQDECFEKLQKKLNYVKPYVNHKTIFIICGDFNNNDPTKIPSFNDLLKIFNRKLKKEPKTIKTCCIPNDDKYNMSFDHIYISSNGKYDKYRTIDKNEKNKYMSDHLPILAKVLYGF